MLPFAPTAALSAKFSLDHHVKEEGRRDGCNVKPALEQDQDRDDGGHLAVHTAKLPANMDIGNLRQKVKATAAAAEAAQLALEEATRKEEDEGAMLSTKQAIYALQKMEPWGGLSALQESQLWPASFLLQPTAEHLKVITSLQCNGDKR